MWPHAFMSLKARIEAVIYAAEEPVTLAQLAGLFELEALASRAARLAPQADAAGPEETPATDAVVEELLPSADDGVASVDGSAEVAPPAAESPASDEAKKAQRLREREVRDELRRLIEELMADYNAPGRGLEIREVAGGYRIGTRPENHDAVRAFIKTLRPPFKLTLQALETLAVIAYKQPVTAPEIGEIRGVDSSGVLGSLIARKLITTAGRKQVVGRPILYKTTKEFLLRFGLKDVNELPSLDEFEKMARELEETDVAETEEQGPIAPGEEELPFAQDEVASVEESSASHNDDNAAPTSEEDVAEQPDAAAHSR